MRHTIWLSLSFVWLTHLSPSFAFATASPSRFAILVGHNRGAPVDRPLRYAQQDAHKLHRTLRELGNFPAANMRLLREPDAKALKRAFDTIATAMRRSLQKQPKRHIVLLFYYSGHADAKYLHLGRSMLPFQTLRGWLRSSPAHARLAILDTCQSGQIIRKKGARRTQRHLRMPPQIRQLTTRGDAIITSSGAHEDSHELEQLQGSIFTHYFLSALRGSADRNRDGSVTLDEAYSYAYQHTTSHTLFLSTGIQHPGFRNELRGHGHLVLTTLKQASAQLHFDAELSGTYYVLQRRQRLLLAELSKKKGLRKIIGLSSGDYIVLKRGSQHYQIQTISLKQGDKHRLRPRRMKALHYANAASKGLRWFTHPKPPRKPPTTPLQTAFRVSLGVSAASLLSTGVLYALAFKFYNDADNSIQRTGSPNAQLETTSTQLNTSAIVTLGISVSAGVGATIFYLLDRKKRQKAPTPPPSSPPPASASALLLPP